MLLKRVALVCVLALAVRADKKIELQDIEEDNLKSEKEKDIDKPDPRSQTVAPASAPGLLPYDFFKNGLLRYFENPSQVPQQPRYVHQYAVTEQPEKPPTPVASPKSQFGSAATQQAMVGYLSNVPMQIYLVPQYYNEPGEQTSNTQPGVQYAAPGVGRISAFPSAPEAVQPQNNFIEVPTYVTPSGKTYIQQPVAYLSYAAPSTVAPVQATTAPVLYQMPVVQYPTAIAAPPVLPKGYYQNQQYTETNNVEDVQENEVESPKEYAAQTEQPYTRPPGTEYPRYYSSRAPLREDPRHSSISELPPPNPLLLKGSPSHLSHIPKALPMFRPLTKPVYAAGGNFISTAYSQKPSESYSPYKRRPMSLLDSYVPSGLQLEYLKRGYIKDPLAAYDALSGSRHYPHYPVPRHYERGFLPNQMYHTAAGGITYGHYKRTPKIDKSTQK